MHTKRELLELLKTHNLRLSKRLGQSYLVDPRLTARLVEVCHLEPDDTVIEIGAGLGALTDRLAASAKRVIAVEVDRGVCEVLRARLAHLKNVEVACQDILEFPWARYPRAKVLGAIPYSITSPILVSLCEQPPLIAEAWLGMQREVAERLIAKPGTKAYGRLTILVQYRFEVDSVMRMSRNAFFPQPKVDSAWVRLTPRRVGGIAPADERLFCDLVRAAFSQRRKTLLNSLAQLSRPRLSREEARAVIRAAGLPEGIRGEVLSLERFVKLANVLAGMVEVNPVR